MADELQLRAHGLRTNVGKLIRVDELEGRPHLVAPVVLITEGVHNNVLYSAAELAKHTDAWNGRPLVAPTHPTVGGKPVTANSKRVLEKMKVGTVLNVRWNAANSKLMGEAWFDKALTAEKAPKILSQLEQEDPKIEVSTGLFTDDRMHVNSFKGKQYACEALNHRPDHLAVLLNEKGACSWEDGAGLPRINSAMDDDELDDFHVNVEGEGEEAPQTPGAILNKLVASEYRAWWTYHIGEQLVMGKGRTVVAAEYGAHAEEELAHAEALIQRLQELELPVTANLADVAAAAGADEAVPTTVAETLVLNNMLENQAVEDYNAAIAFFDELGDESTVLMLTEHMSTEQSHIHDLEQLASDAEVALEDGDEATCPDCGGEMVDGECPLCDGEEEEPKANWNVDQPRDENGRFAAQMTGAKYIKTSSVQIAKGVRSTFHFFKTSNPAKASNALIEAFEGPAAQGVDGASQKYYGRNGTQVTANQGGAIHHYTFLPIDGYDANGSRIKPSGGYKKPAGWQPIKNLASQVPAWLQRTAERLGFNVNAKAKADVSLNEKSNRVAKALNERYAPKTTNWSSGNMATPCMPCPWIRELFDDYVIFDYAGKSFKLAIVWEDGQPVFEGDAVEVVQNTEWLPKNNSADKWVETEETWEVPGWEAAPKNNGGKGSGNFGHGGIPGHQGGSSDGDGGGRASRAATSWNQRGQEALIAERKAAFDKDSASIKLRDMERRSDRAKDGAITRKMNELEKKPATDQQAVVAHALLRAGEATAKFLPDAAALHTKALEDYKKANWGSDKTHMSNISTTILNTGIIRRSINDPEWRGEKGRGREEALKAEAYNYGWKAVCKAIGIPPSKVPAEARNESATGSFSEKAKAFGKWADDWMSKHAGTMKHNADSPTAPGRWVTMNGAHIYVKEGEDPADVFHKTWHPPTDKGLTPAAYKEKQENAHGVPGPAERAARTKLRDTLEELAGGTNTRRDAVKKLEAYDKLAKAAEVAKDEAKHPIIKEQLADVQKAAELEIKRIERRWNLG